MRTTRTELLTAAVVYAAPETCRREFPARCTVRGTHRDDRRHRAGPGGQGLPLPQVLVALSEDPSALPVSLAAVGFALSVVLSFLSHLLLDSLATSGLWPARPGGRGPAFPLVKEGRGPEPLNSLLVTLALLPAQVPTLLTEVAPW